MRIMLNLIGFLVLLVGMYAGIDLGLKAGAMTTYPMSEVVTALQTNLYQLSAVAFIGGIAISMLFFGLAQILYSVDQLRKQLPGQTPVPPHGG